MIKLLRIALIFFAIGIGYAHAEEIKRLPSPDEKVDAVLLNDPGDATAADSLLVYLVPHGHAVGGEPIFQGDHLIGLDLGWNGQKSLVIVHAGGRIFQFRNFWQSAAVDNFRYTVGIHLKESNYAVFKPD